MSEELEKLRKEVETLHRDRRVGEMEWRAEDRQWKKETKDQLTKLTESSILSMQRLANHSQDIVAVATEVRQVGLVVSGNPATRSTGLETRLDRLEQSHKTQTWLTRLLIATGVSSAAAWLFGK